MRHPKNSKITLRLAHPASEKLDGNETIKLMSAINDMKTKPLPSASMKNRKGSANP
jgi:hypothetical protein